MVRDVSYTFWEYSITYRDVESLCCTPKANGTFYVNCTSIEKNKGSNFFQINLQIHFNLIPNLNGMYLEFDKVILNFTRWDKYLRIAYIFVE